MPNRLGAEYTTDAGRRYEAYIGSKAWARKRRAYWKKYGRRCHAVDCDQTANLHVHHHTYERLGDEWLTDLVGLCEKHHHAVHDLYERDGGSLTLATEAVTGLRLRDVTQVKRTRARKPEAPAKQRRSAQDLVADHSKTPWPKGKCHCSHCEQARQPRHGGKGNAFDGGGKRTRGDDGLPKRRHLNRAQTRVQVAAVRAATAERYALSQEVARRIAAARKN